MKLTWLLGYNKIELEKLNTHSWTLHSNKYDTTCSVCGIIAIYGSGVNIKTSQVVDIGYCIPAYYGSVCSCDEYIIRQVLE